MNTSNPASQRAKVSAFIVCFNESHNIRRALESIKWCDEIVIVDSGSNDSTISICEEFHAKVISRRWVSFVDQKRFTLSQCKYDWVLNIDADEEVSSELRKQIIQVLTDDAAGLCESDGFHLSRIVYYLGRFWRKGGWYPEHRLRLSRRSKTTWGGDDPHERAEVSGRTKRLSGDLFHYTYADISEHVRKLNALSSHAAQSLRERGVSFTIFGLLIRPILRFLKFYLLRRGYREGVAGLLVAVLEANYVFLKWVKLWEKERGS